MSVCARVVLVFALALGMVVAFGPRPDEPEEPDLKAGTISEPWPVTLRLCAKKVIVQAAIDDRLSLPEAAALFGEIYRIIPEPPEPTFPDECCWLDEPPATVEDRLCQQVICWVKCQFSDPTTDESVARLESEFREWRRTGMNWLPDPADLVPTPATVLEQARAEWVVQCRGRTVTPMTCR